MDNKGIHPVQRLRFHRHPQNGQTGFRGGHARQMRRAARRGDDDFQAARRRAGGIFKKQVRRAMGRDDLGLIRDAQFIQLVGGVLHRFPIRLASHDEAHEGRINLGLTSGRSLRFRTRKLKVEK